MSPDDLLSPLDVALLLRVAPDTVRKLANSGKLSCRKMGNGRRVFLRADVDAYLVKHPPRVGNA